MMKLSMSPCHQASPALWPPLKQDLFMPNWQKEKEKVVIIMGATGTGKSKLSINLAKSIENKMEVPAEIINSDKMQVYKGLDILTNKISEEEKCGVPHHLLGVIDPYEDFTAADFCDVALETVESILTRGLLPIIVGGSNSYIEELVDGEDYRLRTRYDCCFLWIDVCMPVLRDYVSKRVDQMVNAGMVDEVRNMFSPHADYSRGIKRSIGVSEFDTFLRLESLLDQETRAILLNEAITKTKANTCELAQRQLQKIHRLRNKKGWKLHRHDSTEVFRKKGKEAEEAWEKLVARPSSKIVERLLSESNFAATIPTSVTTKKSDFIEPCLLV